MKKVAGEKIKVIKRLKGYKHILDDGEPTDHGYILPKTKQESDKDMLDVLKSQPKSYCEHCGKEQKEIPSGKYNRHDGSPKTKWACQNQSCQKAYCYDNFGEHDYEILWFKTPKCKRCHEMSDY